MKERKAEENMKIKRIIAVVLMVLLILSGCAPEENEVITQNTNKIPDTQQSAGNPAVAPEEQMNPTPEATIPENNTQTPTENESENSPQKPAESDPASPADPAPTPDTPTQSDPTAVDLSKDVRYFGRTYEDNGTYWFSWTAAGFEFTFNGTGAEAILETDSNGDEHTAYIRIYVDGKAQGRDIAIVDSMQTVTLAKGLRKGVHTVRVVKRTNGRSASLGLMDLTLAKGSTIQTPPTAKERRIEFVGDSITVGYGVLGNASTEAWSTKTEDGTKTYAALAGDALNAEYNVIAISGRGLAHNTSGDTDKLMPYLYTRTEEYRNAGAMWDFKKFQPHVIVINLGTNDHKNSTAGEVTAATTAFLKTVRKNNPSAIIIFAYGMMGNTHEDAIKAGISACGDNKISFLKLKNAVNRVIGHPDAVSHQENAKILEAEIRKLTGWKN